MKRILIASVATLALSQAVSSADLPAAAAYAPEASYASTLWTGFYVGAHIGWVNGEYDAKVSATGAKFPLDNQNEFAGGLYAGYNYQLSNSPVVLGVEADITFYNLDDRATLGASTLDVESNYNASLKGRVGYAFDRFLPYITAGVAFTDVDANLIGTGVDDNNHVGFVVGAGLDYALTQNVIARVEYTYTDFADETYNFAGTLAKADLDTHTVKVGISYKF